MGRTRQDGERPTIWNGHSLWIGFSLPPKIFPAGLGMTICVKNLEASHNMSDDSWYLGIAGDMIVQSCSHRKLPENMQLFA